jgi:hypothetical protein
MKTVQLFVVLVHVLILCQTHKEPTVTLVTGFAALAQTDKNLDYFKALLSI